MAPRIRAFPIVLAGAVFANAPATLKASDACSTPAIAAAADVAVSDGAQYRLETYYRSPKETAVAFIGSQTTVVAVEGPYAWVRNGEDAALAGEAEKRFAIGHQYHAILLYFDEIMDHVEDDAAISFRGETRTGRTGDYPHGGTISLVDGDDPARPAGLLMLLPDESPIGVTFDDWRTHANGSALPYRVMIHHEGRLFHYTYETVDVETGDALDFQNRYASPDLNEVDIYRLHRALLAAHCRGDAGLMADLTAPEFFVASRGELARSTADDLRERFTGVFERLDYTGYHDLADPIIEVAESGDVGWAGVNVRAVGAEKTSGAQFDDQWAWVMLARKIDGAWKNAGNAANRKPD